MKQTLLLIAFAISSVFGFAQIHDVSVFDVQQVSVADLTNCNDSSAYLGDTVRVLGIVMHNGNLTEIASGSTAGGYRAAIHLMDTATSGMGGDFKGIQIHGVFDDGTGNQPVSALNTLLAGDSIQLTGVVGRYQGETQIYPVDNSSVVVLGSGTAPTPRVVSVGDLNDANRVNQLPTGESLEGSLVMLNNVTVTSVNYFSSNTRVSIDVTDASGNTINVSDRFLAQKLAGHTSVNPDSPATNGSFVAPPVGLVYDTLIGIILHSENGCTGSTAGRGYEINPFDASHYIQGPSPASITNVTRMPSVPTSTESPVINCNVIDFAPGFVAQVTLFYTDDIPGGMFDSVNFTSIGGTDDYTANIPAFADGKMVAYYIKATDNDGLVSQYPATPAGSAVNNVKIYTVRDNGLTIVDVQKVLDYNDDSYYTGDTVTVTGVVSASTKDYDLGYVYIQQLGASAWSGLSLIGHSDLILLLRTEEVTVTGVIEEYYGFTRMRVTEVTKTGNVMANEVTYFNPSDANLYTSGQMEEFESMLVGMENGTTGLYMTDEDASYGDYEVGTSDTASTSTMITAGRQSNSAFTSLWVSLVSSGYYWGNDGQMEVDTVITTADMQMDTVAGIMYYGFSNWKVMPRNNDDIMGLSENGTPIVLDSTNLTLPTSVVEINGVSIETVVYPNPASSIVTVAVNGSNDNFKVAIYDLSGRVVTEAVNGNVLTTISVANLQNGVYLIKVTNAEGTQLAIDKIVVKH